MPSSCPWPLLLKKQLFFFFFLSWSTDNEDKEAWSSAGEVVRHSAVRSSLTSSLLPLSLSHQFELQTGSCKKSGLMRAFQGRPKPSFSEGEINTLDAFVKNGRKKLISETEIIRLHLSVNTRPKPPPAFTRERSQVMDQESVYDWRQRRTFTSDTRDCLQTKTDINSTNRKPPAISYINHFL